MGYAIGLLGGVASGKSTVARILAERGLIVIDADAEARAVVEEPAVRKALVERFGADLFEPDGALRRSLLADRVFGDPAATEALNAIVHPPVRQRIREALAAAGDRPVVLDVPLLLESPLAGAVTTWVLVDASEARRQHRASGRGWSPDELSRREARQADLDEKRRRADHVLENNGSIDDLEQQVEALLEKLGLPSRARDRCDPEP